MKAILLAAGRGTRISKDIGETCKCMMDIGGTTLIRNTVEMLLKKNVDVSIVLGYRQSLIRQELKDYPVTYYYNPFYSVTNSIASLWFAKDALTADEIVIGNADVFWQEDIFDAIVHDTRRNFLVADSSRIDPVKGDYFFMHENGVLLSHGKKMEESKITAEYVGLAKIMPDYVSLFKEQLEKLVDEQNHSFWWEDVLYSCIEEKNIYVLDINGMFWMEIDYIDDYYKILEYVRSKNERI